MGQKTALFYKYWILTKRQKAAVFCQVLSPLMAIILIALVLSQIDGFVSQLPGIFGSDVLPGSLYFSNMITPKWEPLWGELFAIENSVRINRYSAVNAQTMTTFQRWINSQSGTLTYEGEDEHGNLILYPIWMANSPGAETSKINQLNQLLIAEIKTLNGLDKNELRSSEDLPDSSMYIRKIDEDYGVDVHFQVNNIAYDEYHRMNGQTYAKQLATDSLSTADSSTVFSTEAGIGQMNLLSNMHVQSIFENDFINIVSLVSQTVDGSTIDELIQSVLAIVCNNMFPVSLCLGFPIMLFVLAMEKEEKIKALLEINGLKTKNYWMSFYGYYFAILEITVIFWLIVGKLYIDIDFFQETSFFLNLWMLTMWNLSQIAFALFCSTFLKNSRTATLGGYQGSIFLLLFLSLLSQFLFPNPSKMPFFFYFFPQTALVRYIYLAISKCIDYECYETIGDIKGEMLTVFLSLHLTFIFYTAVGLLLNEPLVARALRLGKCLAKADTPKKKKKKKTSSIVDNEPLIPEEDKEEALPVGDEYRKVEDTEIEVEESKEPKERGLDEIEDDFEKITQNEKDEGTPEKENKGILRNEKKKINLAYEEKHISARKYEKKVNKTNETDEKYLLLAKKVSKSFPCSQGIKHALSNFSVRIEKGKIFGLLGPNGAGKTTFLSIITGILDADSGTGWICGNRIENTGIHAGNIGFCPQFDILWPLLNVEEHLTFMGMFKGQTFKEVQSCVHELIKDVDLDEDYQKMATQLSGGMKRRCSMAMALTGNPKIIFLDEPSSGLDPVKRRNFWQLIQKVTKERAVLMTTHLMEEADTLCDEIAIITTGKLRCIGNSLSLKSAFTEGIKLQVVLDEQNRTEAKIFQFFEGLKIKIKGVHLEDNFRGTLSLVVKDDTMSLAYLFEVMTELSKGCVQDWSISLGSLEDVFLSVVRKYRDSNIVSDTKEV